MYVVGVALLLITKPGSLLPAHKLRRKSVTCRKLSHRFGRSVTEKSVKLSYGKGWKCRFQIESTTSQAPWRANCGATAFLAVNAGSREPALTSIIVEKAYMSVLVSCDCEGEGGVANYFVDLSWRWIICKGKKGAVRWRFIIISLPRESSRSAMLNICYEGLTRSRGSHLVFKSFRNIIKSMSHIFGGSKIQFLDAEIHLTNNLQQQTTTLKDTAWHIASVWQEICYH